MSSAVSEIVLVRTAFQGVASVREVKMFGGTAFMVNGRLRVCGSLSQRCAGGALMGAKRASSQSNLDSEEDCTRRCPEEAED
jgi:hypothetical protein